MKNIKSYLSGILTGVIITGGVVYASPIQIDAFKDIEFKYFFNGSEKTLSSEYDTLIYKDRVYVPARFVGENIGAKVDYDGVKKSISFELPKTETPTNDNNHSNGNDNQTSKPDRPEKPVENNIYKSLPQTLATKNFEVKCKFWSDDDPNIFKVFLELKGLKDNNSQQSFELLKTVLVVDGVDYPMTGVSATYYDNQMFKNIVKEEYIDGYIPFELLPKDAKNLTLKVVVRESGEVNKTHELEFNFKK